MLGHDRLQGGDGIRCAPGRHQELCLPLPCGHAELVQPQGLGLRERQAGEFAEGRAAPQAEGPIENPEGRPGGRGRGLGLGQGILEPCRIELGALDAEPVPALDGDEAVAGRAERAPQPRDLCPQGTGRVPGKRLAPQLIHEAARGHLLVGRQQQHRKDQPLPGAGEFDRAAVDPNLDRAEQPVPPYGHRDLSQALIQHRTGSGVRATRRRHGADTPMAGPSATVVVSSNDRRR